jgi:hypothetical protein
MQKITIGLSAVLTVAALQPGFAQNASTPATPNSPTACIIYEPIEYPTCLTDEALTEEQARTAHGHPQFIEPQSATASQAREPSGATPDPAAQASRVVPSSHQ